MADTQIAAPRNGAMDGQDLLADVAFDLLAAVYTTLAQHYDAVDPRGYAAIDDALTRQMIEGLTIAYDELPQDLGVDIAFQALVLKMRNVMTRAREATKTRTAAAGRPIGGAAGPR